MKKLLVICLLAMPFQKMLAQVKNPVSWTFSARQLSANSYEVHLTASMEEGWHVYSQTTPDGGPVPTRIEFTKNPLLILKGEPVEKGDMDSHFEPLFGVQVKQYSDKVDFVQIVKTRAKVKTALSGKLVFMTCNDRECLPPATKTFSIAIK